jgi:uncharacterized membrane-anchored protein
MEMRNTMMAALGAVVLALGAVAVPAGAQEGEQDPIGALPWELGPTTGGIASTATLQVPEGFAFLGAAGTRDLEVLMQNPPSSVDQFVVAPLDLTWVAYFSFSPVGYVKDDESLDAAELLDRISEGTRQSNVERRKRGWETLRVVGWSFQPKYDGQLNALEWAILAEREQDQSKIVNYNTRLLGRRGVMEVTVVTDPTQLEDSVAAFKTLMPGYEFGAGEKYAEFRPGDHVAEIGLAALVTGGAAAVASKKGFFAAIGVALLKFWKLLAVGLVAVGAWLRKLLGGKKDTPTA